MTTIGLKIDRVVCETLNRFGVRTPLFSNTFVDEHGTTRVQERQFAICHNCRGIFPHWWANMTAKEQQRRGFIGCRCGGTRLDIAVIPGWKATLWMLYGLIVRRAILKRRLWDPRVPIRDYGLG